jgi:hypothetical protein
LPRPWSLNICHISGFIFWPPLRARCLPLSGVGAFEKIVVRFLVMA